MSQWFSRRGEKNRERRREALSAYLDGELSAREKARLERALAQDAPLRAELAELRRTVQMVRSLPALPVPRSFTLDPAVYGRTRPRRVHLYPVMRAATVLAVVAFVFLTASTFLFRGLTQMAPAGDVAMVEVEVTRVVEKEVLVVETVEVELAVEAEPAEGEAITAAPMMEAPAPAEPAAETAVEEAEAVVPEAEPADAAQEEMAAPAAPSPDAAPSATPAAAPEVGVGAGEPLPSVEVSPTPEPTPEPTAATLARAAEESVEAPPEAPLPEALPAVEQPLEAPLPEATPTEPVEEPPEADTDQGRLGQVDWRLLAGAGAGLLGVGLLVVTLLARRFGW